MREVLPWQCSPLAHGSYESQPIWLSYAPTPAKTVHSACRSGLRPPQTYRTPCLSALPQTTCSTRGPLLALPVPRCTPGTRALPAPLCSHCTHLSSHPPCPPADHFQHEHYLCPHPDCLEKKFIVFPSEQELKTHTARCFGCCLTCAAALFMQHHAWLTWEVVHRCLPASRGWSPHCALSWGVFAWFGMPCRRRQQGLAMHALIHTMR